MDPVLKSLLAGIEMLRESMDKPPRGTCECGEPSEEAGKLCDSCRAADRRQREDELDETHPFKQTNGVTFQKIL